MNFNLLIKKNIHHTVFEILVICFVLFKSTYWALPFYWDESWVYGPAVRLMSMDVPSILPHALPADITRGHPLLFTFLGGTWLWLFGNTIVNAHIFSTLVSVVLIVSVYLITNQLCNKNAGIIASATLILQPVFLSQSGMVLPEIMVALFSLLSLYCFYKNKILLCSASLTGLLFTKESGIVVLLTIYLFEFYNIIKYKKLSTNRILTLLMPSVAIAIFFAIQKVMMGWYFFPEHTSLIDFNANSILEKLMQYFSFTFIYQGRNVLFFLALGFVFYNLIKAKNILFNKKIIAIWAVFTLMYLIFSSINFYSGRYAMNIIVPFVIGFAIVTEEILQNNWIKSLFIVGIAFHFVFVNIQRQDNSDQTLGYKKCIQLQEEVIAYLQENHLEEKKIYAGFLLRNAMTDPLSGYVEIAFPNIAKNPDADCDYFVLSNSEREQTNISAIQIQAWKWKNYEIGLYGNQ